VTQEAVYNELKKVRKEEFSAFFRNCTAAQTSVYMLMELILNTKKLCFFFTCLRFFFLKKQSQNFWTAVFTRLTQPVLSYGREARTVSLLSDERPAKSGNRIRRRIFGQFHENDLGRGLRNKEPLYVHLYGP
jgi:hypothetical protein